jgi:hypothetical protein
VSAADLFANPSTENRWLFRFRTTQRRNTIAETSYPEVSAVEFVVASAAALEVALEPLTDEVELATEENVLVMPTVMLIGLICPSSLESDRGFN